jgi:alpha-L-fucosidase 2
MNRVPQNRTLQPSLQATRGFLLNEFAAAIAGLLCLSAAHAAPADTNPIANEVAWVKRYNVVWTSPSKDATGVMPIGNGDIGAGVYAVADGDLYLLLAKNDAFNYQGEIYKTGRLRVSLEPNPFKAGRPFRQVLDLATGCIQIEADGVNCRIWADANRPVFHVQVQAQQNMTVKARPEFWKRPDGTPDVSLEREGKILWYFAVGDRSVYQEDLKFYGVEEMAAKYPDPYRFNMFGHLLESPEMSADRGELKGSGRTFDIRVQALGMKSPKASEWIEAIARQSNRPLDTMKDWAAHCRWWAEFWQRSWIQVTDNSLPPEAREQFLGEPSASGARTEADGAALAAQSYNVFRFLMACQSRGRIQVKFNGGLFTQPLRVTGNEGRPGAARQADGSWLTHEDDRLWGRRFTFQNQRLLYWPMLGSGDFDLMRPFFDYYSTLLPIRMAITKAWFGHEGAHFRENIEPTGAERDCDHGGRPPKTKPGEAYEGWYHDYYFTSGLETLRMMTDYVNYTGDEAFREQALVPFAREVLLFFDQHYPRGADGKLRLEPAQVLETYWIAVNPAPDIAGLRVCLDALLAMQTGSAQDQSRWRRLRGEIPEVPLHVVDGRQAIAPAEKWAKLSNAENGELYPVFPFPCFGLGLGSGEIVEWTMKNRSNKDVFGNACWTQDQIHWAYAGRAREASRGLVRRFRVASAMCRFPMYGREGPDSCPDFDHFGAGAIALQRMLVQEAGDKILLLPAWPANWDADFKLHLSGRTVVTGTVKDGKLVRWDLQPVTRKSQVIVGQPQIVATTGGVIPANDHPLLAGADQSGGSRFEGKIGRVTMFRGELTDSDIRRLASSERSKPVLDQRVIGSWLNPKVGDALATKVEQFENPVAFEAWIQPGPNESGRILDKITVGSDDGFLVDAWPKLGLRLIVGEQQRQITDVLKPGVWQHFAIVFGPGSQQLYLDGVKK